NTTTGALKVNGNEGQAGQVITSNGSAAAQWKSPTNVLYQHTNMNVETGTVTLGSGGSPTLVPGLSQAVNVSGNAKLVIQFGVVATTLSCAFCGVSATYIDVVLDGVLQNRVENDVANGAFVCLTGSWLLEVATGNHTVEIHASAVGPNVRFGYGGNLHSNL